MWELVKIFGYIILFSVLIQFFDLPDWIGRKLRGEIPNKEITEKLTSLELRVKQLEEKINSKE